MRKRLLLILIALVLLCGAAFVYVKVIRRDAPLPPAEQPDNREAFQALQDQANAITESWTISSYRPGEAILAQIGAPEMISETWQSRTGKTHISLQDVPVVVPQTNELFMIYVSPRLFSTDEVQRVLHVFSPDAEAPSLSYQPQTDKLSHQRIEWSDEHARLKAYGYEEQNTVSQATIQCIVPDDAYITGGMKILQRWHEGEALRCRYSLDEARGLADAAAGQIASDYVFSEWGLMELYPVSGEDTSTQNYEYQEGYRFCYVPVIEGIPMLYTPLEDSVAGLTLLPVRLPRLYISITNSGIYEVHWEGAQEITGKEPVNTLLRFDQILDIARTILPLAHMEIEKSFSEQAMIKVDRVELSYCRVQRRDQPGRFMILPVWDFFGSCGRMTDGVEPKEWDAQWNTNPSTSLLTINAIDGTVIDRKYGY